MVVEWNGLDWDDLTKPLVPAERQPNAMETLALWSLLPDTPSVEILRQQKHYASIDDYSNIPFISTFVSSPTLIYEHPSGGRLYQTGYAHVPEDPSEIDVDLIVAASTKYVQKPKHNAIITLFRDEINISARKWERIKDMIVPAVARMAETLEAGRGVLSVCRAGINRSSLLTGLTLREVTDLDPREIVELIRSRRGYDCLFNEDFKNIVLHGF